MCTVTWHKEPDGLRIFCNRDEMRLREPATAPSTHERDGIQYLAPHDGRAGGTWIGVNEHGLAVSLLNHYPLRNDDNTPPTTFTSRGELVLSLLAAPDLQSARAQLKADRLTAYRPFIVLLFSRDQDPERISWNGRSTLHATLSTMEPQTSSSFMTKAVIASRLSLFQKLPKRIEAEDLRQYHSSHHPSKGAYSVCMHRPEAHTVSFTEILLGSNEATIRYQACSPCKSSEASEISATVDRLTVIPPRTVAPAGS